MDLDSKVTTWWASLSPARREEAALVHDALPPWMVESLAAHGLKSIGADLTGHQSASLMPTAVRDFIAAQLKNMPHKEQPEVRALRFEVERLLEAALRHEAELGRRDEMHIAETSRRDQLHIDEMGRRDHFHLDEMSLLSRAIQSRDTMGQAKGVIMVTMRCTAEEAFLLIREQSQRENRSVHDVAEEIARRALERRPALECG